MNRHEETSDEEVINNDRNIPDKIPKKKTKPKKAKPKTKGEIYIEKGKIQIQFK